MPAPIRGVDAAMEAKLMGVKYTGRPVSGRPSGTWRRCCWFSGAGRGRRCHRAQNATPGRAAVACAV